MARLEKQDQLLAASSYMCSIAKSAQSSKKISPREKALLLDRQDKVLSATSVISTLISSRFDDPVEADAVFGAICVLSTAMFDIGMITHVTEAATKFVDDEKNKLRRKGKDERRAGRSAIMDAEFESLLKKGFGGETLRKELIKRFRKGNVPEKLAAPSVQRVKSWATNFRKSGDWRDPAKPRPE